MDEAKVVALAVLIEVCTILAAILYDTDYYVATVVYYGPMYLIGGLFVDFLLCLAVVWVVDKAVSSVRRQKQTPTGTGQATK